MSQASSHAGRPAGCGIFISHSSRDAAIAAEIAARLDAWGFQSLFLDFDPERGIPAGRDWEREIYRHIGTSGALVVVSSAHWLASRWCFAEFAQARALGKEILPIRVDDAPVDPQLSQRQVIDIREGDTAFDRLRRGLREAGLDPDDDFTWDRTREPYPGLNVFTEDDAGVYFGREELIHDTLDRLTQMGHNGEPRVALVVGASGSGKSSLLRAGVIPRLKKAGRNWWVLPPIRPQLAPVDSLAQALAAAPPHPDWKRLRACLFPLTSDSTRALVEACLDARLAGSAPEAPVLVVVDQLEESLGASSEEHRAFHLLLRRAVEPPDSPVFLLATLRSDFLGLFQNHPDWGGLKPTLINVGTLSMQNVPQIIEGPAARSGMSIEPGLVPSMLHDAATDDALPLLAFTLRELYLRCKARGQLTLDVYRRDLKGLQGAVERVIDRLKSQSELDGSTRQDVRRAFLNLAQIGVDGRFVRRSAAWDDMPERARPFLEKCVSSRLLTTSDSNGVRTLEVTHESLFRVWPELAGWLDESRAFLSWARRIRTDADEWHAGGRSAEALLPEGRVPEARKWLADRGDDLSLVEHAFVTASIAAQDQAAIEEAARQQREIDTQRQLRDAAEARAVAEARLRSDAERLSAAEKIAAERSRRSAIVARRFSYALGLLVIVTGGLAWMAYRQQAIAHQQQLTAESRGLAAQAQQKIAEDRPLALTMAMQAWGLAKTEEARAAVAEAFPVQLATLRGASQSLWDGSFSPDGRRVIAAGGDRTVRVWNAGTGRELFTLVGHTDAVDNAAFAPDGRRVVTASRDSTARIWDTVTLSAPGAGASIDELPFAWGAPAVMNPVRGQVTLQHPGGVANARFSPDGLRVVTACKDGTVRVWDVASGALAVTLEGHASSVNDAEFSSDGQRIVSASEDRTARVWNAVTGRVQLTLRGHTDQVWRASFSPDGRYIATASWDKTAAIWDADTGRLVATLTGHTYQVQGARFSPDSQLLVTAASDNTPRVWRATTGSLLATLEGHAGPINRASFTPDGQQIVTASYDKTARVWTANTGKVLATLRGHTDTVSDAVFSPDGQRILTVSDDRTAKVWNTVTTQLVETFKEDNADVLRAAAFSPGGDRVVMARSDTTARVWNTGTGQAQLTLQGHTDQVTRAEFSLDGQRILTAGDDKTVRVWEAKTGKETARLNLQSDIPSRAAFSPDGRRIVTADWDGAARVWNADTGAVAMTLEGHKGPTWRAIYSRDGRLIVTSGSDKTARVWDANTGQPIATLAGHADMVPDVTFTPDGQRVITASHDHTARLWNVATGQEQFVLRDHLDGIGEVRLSPDGTRIVTVAARSLLTRSKDPTSRVWDASSGRLIAPLEVDNSAGVQIVDATFSTDSRWIIVRSLSGASVWNADTGQLLTPLDGALEYVNASFTTDGRQVLIAARNAVRRYRLVTLSEIADLTSR